MGRLLTLTARVGYVARRVVSAIEVAGAVDTAGRWVALLAATATVLAIGFLWARLATPSDNARLEPGEPVWRADGVVVTPVVEQPDSLRQGDLVIAVESRGLEAWADALLQLEAPEIACARSTTCILLKTFEM